MTRILGPVQKAPRGLQVIFFEDMNRQECSIQQSSAAEYAIPGTSAIWLGVGERRMRLNRDQAKDLTATINRWLKNGKLGSEPSLTVQPKEQAQ